MFTEYEKAELMLLTLDENNNSGTYYRRVANHHDWAIYEIVDTEDWLDAFWYIAINRKEKEVLVNPEYYDSSELPDITEMLEDFEYYFN